MNGVQEDVAVNRLKVEHTDSQRSVATSNIYSQDFTDSSSNGNNNSSGKDTYVIDCDSDDSQVSQLEICEQQSAVNIDEIAVIDDTDPIVNYAVFSRHESFESCVRANPNHEDVESRCDLTRESSTSSHRCSYVAQETFTQTSRTVFELAQLDRIQQSTDHKAIETQTSFVSIIKSKMCDYTIQVDSKLYFTENTFCSQDVIEDVTAQEEEEDIRISNTTEIDSFQVFSTNNNNYKSSFDSYKTNSDSLEIIEERDFFENTSDYDNIDDTSKLDSDCEVDSLQDVDQNETEVTQDRKSETSVPMSVDNDVEELYSNLEKCLDIHNLVKPTDTNKTRYVNLTPFSEESTVATKTRSSDTTCNNNMDIPLPNLNVIFMNKCGIEVKNEACENEKESFKLPPIHNQSCPSNPHLNSLFRPNRLGKRNTSPSLPDRDSVDRQAVEIQDLAAGESTHIQPDEGTKHRYHLPSIYIEGHVDYGDTADSPHNVKSRVSSSSPRRRETISIQEKIKDLKMDNARKYSYRKPETRSPSPKSRSESPECAAAGDAAARSSDALCQAVLKKLQSQSWFEVIEVLEDLENVFKNAWYYISEQRIADLIRQVLVHVDSPRTQVARISCGALAAILKNTKYTKKPDFYEAVTCLLAKTGSYSKPVRHAANTALDGVVSGTEPAHAVAALCVQGVSHKSGLVRCAAARLLAVAAALARGGRGLLRARPPSAARARRLALRALSSLLDDKNKDARKYAERLYSMLRPQPSFEAFFLTDVDFDKATKQMKKYDPILFFQTHEAR